MSAAGEDSYKLTGAWEVESKVRPSLPAHEGVDGSQAREEENAALKSRAEGFS